MKTTPVDSRWRQDPPRSEWGQGFFQVTGAVHPAAWLHVVRYISGDDVEDAEDADDDRSEVITPLEARARGEYIYYGQGARSNIH